MQKLASGTGIYSNSYLIAGDYTIRMRGQASRIAFDINSGGITPNGQLIDILTPVYPAVVGITSAHSMFKDCVSITAFTAQDFFDDVSSNVVTMSHMFAGAQSFNQSLDNWDVF